MKKNAYGFAHLMAVLVIVLIVAVAGVGYYVYSNQKVDPDKLMKTYLEKTAQEAHSEVKEEFKAEGSELKGTGILQAKDKKFLINGTLVCKGKIGGQSATVDVSVQVENSTPYVRFNSVEGNVTGTAGTQVDLAKMFSKTLGQWYKGPEDANQKTKIENAVYPYNSGVIAPNEDASKIANTLLDKKAFTFEYTGKEGSNHGFKLTAHKDAYLTTVKELFPNLKDPSAILDEVFDGKSEMVTTIVVSKSGELISEKYSSKNECVDLFENFFGAADTGLPKEVTGTSTPVSQGTVKIDAVQNAKSVDAIGDDITL